MNWMQDQSRFDSESAEKSLNHASAAMRQFACALSLGLAASSVLIATAALGQPSVTQSNNRVQHLTCVEEGKHLVCDVQPEPVNHSTAAEQSDLAKTKTEHATTALINPQTDEAIANFLLGACYIGMPLSLVLAFWLYGKHDNRRAVKLKEQVELLERIWKETQTR
jgi:hypothetical protein